MGKKLHIRQRVDTVFAVKGEIRHFVAGRVVGV
jgi:hypothetical protein